MPTKQELQDKVEELKEKVSELEEQIGEMDGDTLSKLQEIRLREAVEQLNKFHCSDMDCYECVAKMMGRDRILCPLSKEFIARFMEDDERACFKLFLNKLVGLA